MSNRLGLRPALTGMILGAQRSICFRADDSSVPVYPMTRLHVEATVTATLEGGSPGIWYLTLVNLPAYGEERSQWTVP